MKKRTGIYPIDINALNSGKSLETFFYGIDNTEQIRIIISLNKLGKSRYTQIARDTGLENIQVTRQLEMMIKNKTVISELKDVANSTLFLYSLSPLGLILGIELSPLQVAADNIKASLIVALSKF